MRLNKCGYCKLVVQNCELQDNRIPKQVIRILQNKCSQQNLVISVFDARIVLASESGWLTVSLTLYLSWETFQIWNSKVSCQTPMLLVFVGLFITINKPLQSNCITILCKNFIPTHHSLRFGLCHSFWEPKTCSFSFHIIKLYQSKSPNLNANWTTTLKFTLHSSNVVSFVSLNVTMLLCAAQCVFPPKVENLKQTQQKAFPFSALIKLAKR